jgi:uncharacterized protein (TIGR02145 family)
MPRSILLVSFILFLLFDLSGQTTLLTSNDTTICLGGSATMSATVTSGSYGTSSYTFETYAYTPEPYTGGTQVCASFNNCSSTAGGKDDCYAGPFNIGFDFCFFNQTYTQFWIGSNGWISFSAPPSMDWDTFTATTIPNTATSVPKNVIFFPWEDWLPCKTVSNVFFYNTGTAPNMKLVVYWANTTYFDCNGSKFATFQAVLNQQSSIIENHIQDKPQCGSDKSTQGVQNIDGTVAFTATGRNFTQWSATNESTRFVPSGIVWYTGGFPGGTIVGYGTPITFSPGVTTTYTAVVTLCDASVATGNVTVTVVDPQFSYPQPAYCQSDPNPTPTVAISTGTFTASPAGIVFINANTGTINLGASAPGTYTITYTITNPCTVASVQSLTINGTPATPTPLATYVSRCGAGQVTFGVVQPPGVTIHWYDAAVGGILLPFAGATVTTIVPATTHYYAEAVTNSTTCLSLARADIIVVIKPIPVITNSILNYTLCSRDSLKISLTSSLPASTFSWTAFSNAVTLSGYANGSGSKIAQKLVNSGSVNDTVIYSVVATKDTCISDTVKFIAVVKPLFDVVAAPLSQTICSNNLITVNLTSSNPTTLFSWISKGNYAGLSGFANGSGNTISQTLLNAGPADGTVTYKIYPQGAGCTGDTVEATVLVHAQPIPVITGTAVLCVGSAGVVYSTQAGMNNYQWVVSGGGLVTAGGTINSNSVTVTWNTPGAQTVTVNYHDTFGCTAAAPTTFPVTVNPLPGPAGGITGSSVTCQAATGIAYSVKGVTDATTYSWILAPISAGAVTGNTTNITIDWAAGFSGTANLTTKGVNNCGNGAISSNFPILVNPKPYVSFIMCTDSITVPTARIITLRDGIPPGGSFSGAGVNTAAGTFDPATAGLGTHIITYSYTNINTCVNSASQTITVTNPGLFFCGSNLKDVRDNKVYPTIQLGGQCWMAANLDFGSIIPASIFQRDNCIPEKYCFNNITTNCGLQTYYQWDEMMTYTSGPVSQGLCPPGWHVPTEAEWTILFNNYINSGFAGAALKSTGYSGFDAEVAGFDIFNRNYYYNNFAGLFWSADAHGPFKAWAHGMNTFNPSVSFYPSSRSNAFSVRCIKD